MTKKTLEDKVKDANTAFGNEFTPKIESLGYFLTYGISRMGLRYPEAPKKDKNKPCLVAYITSKQERKLNSDGVDGPSGCYISYTYPAQRIEEPDTLIKIAREIIPFKYKGFRVFLEYREALKPRDDIGPKPAYGVPLPPDDDKEEGPVPAYGVPLPPKKKKKKDK